MARQMQDDADFLREAKAALTDLDAEKARSSRLQAEEKRLSRSLDAEKRSVSESITSTVNKRKDSINASYDREMNRAQDRLKKAKARREKAKNQGIKSRINSETAELKEENRRLKLQNSTSFRQNKIPRICNSKFYFALYFTKGIGEALILLLTFLIAFLVIPCGIYFLTSARHLWLLIIIYVADIIVFCGAYILLNNRTKVNKLEVMRDIRKNRDMIAANKRKIRVITKAIERDRNEEGYNLARYDREIEDRNEELAEIARRKQEALGVFENETKKELEHEIYENRREKLEEMKRELADVTAQAKSASASAQQKSIEFTDRYGAYIGPEFMYEDRLDKLIDILDQGLASGITEAQQIYKNVK